MRAGGDDGSRRGRTLTGKGREQAATTTAGEGTLTGKGQDQAATTTAGEGSRNKKRWVNLSKIIFNPVDTRFFL